MRIISIYLLKWNPDNVENPFFVSNVHELGFVSFFKRPFLKQHLNFGARTTTAKSKPGDSARIEVTDAEAICYIQVLPNNLAGLIFADSEYPEKVAFSIINETFRAFFKQYNETQLQLIDKDVEWSLPQLSDMIQKYQDPREADKLLKLQSELNEVTKIAYKTMDDLMKRGETLEGLMSKSKDINGVSLDFYKKARQTNKKCCSLY